MFFVTFYVFLYFLGIEIRDNWLEYKNAQSKLVLKFQNATTL